MYGSGCCILSKFGTIVHLCDIWTRIQNPNEDLGPIRFLNLVPTLNRKLKLHKD